jgi:hypothetical protein
VSPYSAYLTQKHGPGTDNMAAAITKLSNGKFLLAVIKSSPTKQVEFYVSTGTNLDASDVFGTDDRNPDAIWQTDPGWQNMNFIVDCSGEIFLLAFSGGYDDYIDLYKISLYEGGTKPDPYYKVNPTPWDDKHMYCTDNSDQDQCDFKAAAGSYIDPNGQVVIYSVNWDNDGPATSYVYGNGNPWNQHFQAHGGYLRGVEFHERHGNLGQATACPTLSDAWVEFYEHRDFNSYGENLGQYYRVDYNERDAKNGKAMGSNYFNDKASSIRWCIPTGNSFKFYRDNWSGPYQYLNGAGDVRYITNLEGLQYAHGGGRANDSISSYHFHENYVDSLGWYGYNDDEN